MNHIPYDKNNYRNNLDLNNNRRLQNYMINDATKGYKQNLIKGVSLTPDRKTNQINNRDNLIINNNTRMVPRNNSAKKLTSNNIYDTLNKDKKEVSQISFNDYSTISKLSNKSMVQAYLDRRHLETQQKINKLRHEKFHQEASELRFKPNISENSKRIINNLVSKEKPVKINPNLLIRDNNNSYGTLQAQKINSDGKKNIVQKYSQLEDYKKIAEKRENINNLYRQESNLDVKLN